MSNDPKCSNDIYSEMNYEKVRQDNLKKTSELYQRLLTEYSGKYSNYLQLQSESIGNPSDTLLKNNADMAAVKNKPEIIVSGTSEKTIDNANKYADAHLSMYSSYQDSLKHKIKTKRVLVACIVIVRETKDEAQKVYDQLPDDMGKKSCLFGTENEIIESIEAMKSEGITDILISRAEIDKESYRIC